MTLGEHPRQLINGPSDLVKIRFPLPAEDSDHGVDAENLWAENLGVGRYRIENVPFYAYGISFHDEVCADERGDRLTFLNVKARSGHSTYRVLIKNRDGFKSKDFARVWVALSALGCSYEVAKRRWVAIDVPASADIYAVFELLEAGEEEGVWNFEEGHCGHQVLNR